jgi:hypothetical protein
MLACLVGIVLTGCDSSDTTDEPAPTPSAPSLLDPIARILEQRERGGETACRQQLLQWRFDLALGAEAFLRGLPLEGKTVPFLLLERSEHLAGEPRMLRCPSVRASNAIPSREAIARRDPSATDYEGPDGIEATPRLLAAGRFPLLWDREGNHPGFRHVLFTDGRVERIEEPEFHDLLEAIAARRQSEEGG